MRERGKLKKTNNSNVVSGKFGDCTTYAKLRIEIIRQMLTESTIRCGRVNVCDSTCGMLISCSRVDFIKSSKERPRICANVLRVWPRGISSPFSIRWMERMLMCDFSESSFWVSPLDSLPSPSHEAVICLSVFCMQSYGHLKVTLNFHAVI
jgi:hypothetical protein